MSLDKDGNLSAKATTDGTTVLWSVEMNGDGIAVRDKNGNKITMTSSGMVIEDKNGNKAAMTAQALPDTPYNMLLEDKSHNKVKLQDVGMSIEDKNGCTFVTDSAGTTINGSLWVKKPASTT